MSDQKKTAQGSAIESNPSENWLKKAVEDLNLRINAASYTEQGMEDDSVTIPLTVTFVPSKGNQ